MFRGGSFQQGATPGGFSAWIFIFRGGTIASLQSERSSWHQVQKPLLGVLSLPTSAADPRDISAAEELSSVD